MFGWFAAWRYDASRHYRGQETDFPRDHASNIESGDKGLIGGPTRLTGKTKTDVVLEAARRVAEEALLDRTVFVVGREPFEAFRARLDEPPNPNAKLRRALQTAAPWE